MFTLRMVEKIYARNLKLLYKVRDIFHTLDFKMHVESPTTFWVTTKFDNTLLFHQKKLHVK